MKLITVTFHAILKHGCMQHGRRKTNPEDEFMKVVAISDIHANHLALESILRYVDHEGIKHILFLGDYITDCPYPGKTMKLLYECMNKHTCFFIRGNREDYLINHHCNPNDNWIYSSSTGSLLYTYQNMTQRDLDFFTSMPVSMKVTIDNCPSIFICHGSPDKTKEWLFEKDDLIHSHIKDIDCNLFVFGHSHRSYSTNILGKKVVFCPSAGLPANNNINAQFLLLEYNGNEWISQIASVPYNHEKLILEFYESRLIEKAKIWARCIIKQLSTGIECCASCVKLARKMADSDSSEDAIPEKYWIEAARELGIC